MSPRILPALIFGFICSSAIFVVALAQEPPSDESSKILSTLSAARLVAEQAAEDADKTQRIIAGMPSRTELSASLENDVQAQLKSAKELVVASRKLSEEVIVQARNSKADHPKPEAVADLQRRAEKNYQDAKKIAEAVAETTAKVNRLALGSDTTDGSKKKRSHKRGIVQIEPEKRPGVPSAIPGSDLASCIAAATCTPVPVFFGTNRMMEQGLKRITFNAGRADDLVLGKAIVTVPKAHRKKGEVNRPSWWDLLQLQNPWRENPADHFVIPDGGISVYSSEDAFLVAARQHMANGGAFKDHVFVFVHGFNTSFDDALYRTAQISYDLGSNDTPFGTAFLFSWPSAGEIIDYPGDSDAARYAMPFLKAFLNTIIKKTGAQHVHLIAHSMGNFPLLQVLHDFAAEQGTAPKLSEVIFAAPDIDAKEFRDLAGDIPTISRGVTLYASSKDGAMQLSRKLHTNQWRAGDVPPNGPVIVKGIESVDISNVSMAWLALNHSTYAESKELLNDIWQLMSNAKHPPDARNVNLQIEIQGDRKYWKFAN